MAALFVFSKEFGIKALRLSPISNSKGLPMMSSKTDPYIIMLPHPAASGSAVFGFHHNLAAVALHRYIPNYPYIFDAIRLPVLRSAFRYSAAALLLFRSMVYRPAWLCFFYALLSVIVTFTSGHVTYRLFSCSLRRRAASSWHS